MLSGVLRLVVAVVLGVLIDRRNAIRRRRPSARRVDLACTLMGSPELAILDEPTTGLDPKSRREVWRLVSDLRDNGATVLITTHYLEEAETLADRMEIMHAGRIVRSGTPTEISAGYPSTISFANGPDVPEDLAGVRRVLREYGRTTLQTDKLPSSLSDLMAWAARNRWSSTSWRPAVRASSRCFSRSPMAPTLPPRPTPSAR